MDSVYVDKDEKKLTKKEVRSILPIYTLLCAKEKEIHGYNIMKRIQNDFHMLLSPSEVYPTCWALKKDGFLISTEVRGEDGKTRIEYRTNEPKASRHIDKVFRIRNMVTSRLDIMRRNAERDSLNFQVIAPEAIETRVSRWRARADFD